MKSASIGVKWVYQTENLHGRPVEAGQKPSLCFRGREYMLCVAVGPPVRVLKRPVADFDVLRPVMLDEGEYPVSKAIETLQEIASRTGITLGASRLLDRAVERASIESDEDQFNNEEDQEEEMRNEKPAEEVTADSGESETQTEAATSAQETTVKKTTKSKKAKTPAKAVAKVKAKTKRSNGADGPSACTQACDFMRSEVKKEGGAKSLERGFLKELFEKTGKKFGLKASTCGIQYNRNVLNKGAGAKK